MVSLAVWLVAATIVFAFVCALGPVLLGLGALAGLGALGVALLFTSLKWLGIVLIVAQVAIWNNMTKEA